MFVKEYAEVLLDKLSGKIAKDYAIELSKFHRVKASPVCHEAVLYYKDILEKIGFDEVTLEQFPADGKTKSWTFEPPISWRINDGDMWMIEPRNELLSSYKEIASGVLTGSTSTDIVAEVVDIGQGDEEDYEGKDVRGKIVMVCPPSRPRCAHDIAVMHGAVGMIIYPPYDISASYPDMIMTDGILPLEENRENITFGFSISYRQSEMLKSFLIKGEKVKVHCKVDAENYDGTMDVLTTKIIGTERPQEEIVFTAHIDHWRTSSNDNASSCGTILEIARSIKELIEEGKIESPKRTIRFMWVTHMDGTVAWMFKHQDLVKGILVNLNFDMIGGHPAIVGAPLNLVKAPDSTPSYLNDLLSFLFDYVSDHPKGIEPLEGWRFGLSYRIKAYRSGSDHQLFADSVFGIPSVMFNNPDQFHHTSYDSDDKLDSTKLQRVGVIAGAAALTISNADETTALSLTSLTSSQGYSRVGRITQQSIEKLISIAEMNLGESLAEELGITCARGLRKIEIVAEREIKSILSTRTLTSKRSNIIVDFAKNMRSFCDTEMEKLTKIYNKFCKDKNIESMIEDESDDALIAKEIVPHRNFEGPAGRRDFWGRGHSKVKNVEDISWLKEFIHLRALEFMNMTDGKRSLYDIAMALGVEYMDVDLSDTKRFFDICRDAEFVFYEKASS